MGSLHSFLCHYLIVFFQDNKLRNLFIFSLFIYFLFFWGFFFFFAAADWIDFGSQQNKNSLSWSLPHVSCRDTTDVLISWGKLFVNLFPEPSIPVANYLCISSIFRIVDFFRPFFSCLPFFVIPRWFLCLCYKIWDKTRPPCNCVGFKEDSESFQLEIKIR